MSRALHAISCWKSLFHSWQELRNKIVPSARAYRLEKLMDALDGHLRGPGTAPPPAAISVDSTRAGDEKSIVGDHDSVEVGEETEERIAGVLVGGKGLGRRALIEYVMLAGVNDTEECARQLGELLKVRMLSRPAPRIVPVPPRGSLRAACASSRVRYSD